MNEEVTENVTTDSPEADETIQEEPGESEVGSDEEGVTEGTGADSDIEKDVPQERIYTEIVTDNSTIQVIHEITLGEIVNTTVIAAILLFLVIDRFIRR